MSDSVSAQSPLAQPVRRRRRWPFVVAAAVLVVLVAAAAVTYLLYTGALVPANASAKYDFCSYITEEQVTDYITTYKEQMGFTSDTDEAWVEFYQTAQTTPELLRTKTIRQLIIDAEVEKRCRQLGIEADESTLETFVQTMKYNYAMDDDEIWQQTLEMYGRTEEEVRETYATVLKTKALYEAEVPVPEATDEQTASYLAATYPEGGSAKHIYYLRIENDESLSEYENLKNAQRVHNALEEAGLSVENFQLFVSTYCTDDDLVSRGGADGWSLDIADRTTAYQAAVEDTKVGKLSLLFNEDGAYSMVWIDSKYRLPSAEDAEESGYFDDMPDTLKSYFADCAAQELWSDDCDAYLEQLFVDAQPLIFATTTEAAYYVELPAGEDAGEGTGEEGATGEDAEADIAGEGAAEGAGDDTGEGDAG